MMCLATYVRFERDGSIGSWGDGKRAERSTPEPKEPRVQRSRQISLIFRGEHFRS